MGTVLRLASVNVERSKHIPRVISFLQANSPEIVCVQELVPEDIEPLCRQADYRHHMYVPMCRFPEQNGPRATGIGILSRHAFAATQTVHYAGGGSGSDLLNRTSEESRYQSNRYSVAIAEICSGSESLTIATTHFPWSDDAQTRDFQRTACDSLLRVLEGRSLVLAGDFNAPRGREIFGRLAAHWTDNIPSAVTSSLDPVLHRAAPLALMVDGIFSTPDYLVSDVKLHRGVSDHCAITALVSKRNTAAG